MAGEISRDQLQSKIDRRQHVKLVETLAEDQFRQGHLPGAVNLPPDRIRDQASALLPDISDEIVVYCGSAECTASEKAAEQLEKMGYKNVRRYVGGKQDWLDAGLPLEGAPHEAVATGRDTTTVPPAAPAPR